MKTNNFLKIIEQVKNQTHVPVILPSVFTNGLGQIRSLGRRGIKSIVACIDNSDLSLSSRYSVPMFIRPPWENEQVFIDELLLLGENLNGRGVLFFSYPERFLPTIWKFKEEITKHFVLPFDIDTIYFLEDKENQIKTAMDAGIDVPKTIFTKKQQPVSSFCLNELKFPIFIRPKQLVKEFYLEFGVQGSVACNEKQLTEKLIQFNAYPLIIQEYIDGSDTERYFFGSYSCKKHGVLGSITYTLIRAVREHGSAAMAISCENPSVFEAGSRFLKYINYHGPSDIAFKYDARDGKYKFIEINNRFWKCHSLAQACGVDLPYLQYQDAIGKVEKGSQKIQTNGVRWWLPWMDMWSSGKKIIKGEMRLRDYLKTLSFNFTNGVGSWDDPLPEIKNFLSFKWRA